MASWLRPSFLRPLARPQLTTPVTHSAILPFLAPAFSEIRHASGLSVGNRQKQKLERLKKRRKVSKTYRRYDMKKAQTFSLLEAMRYIKAFEVGRDPEKIKYELVVSFNTNKNSPVVRGAIRIPHAIDTSKRIAVLVPPDSDAAKAAVEAGADIVGEDDLIAKIQANEIDFQRLILHPDSEGKLRKANVGRILGPKGLMPNHKTRTITRDVAGAIRDMTGASEYRERDGQIRLAIGQLAFTPDQLESNIKVLMGRVKEQAAVINGTIKKELHEVILSSSNAPGFPLSGAFSGGSGIPAAMLESSN